MKKLIIIFMALSIAMFSFTGCKKDSGTVQVFVPDGAPAFAVAALLKEQDFSAPTKFTVVNPAFISRRLVTGEADIAVVPTNIAAKLFNEGKPYVMLASVTQGNLYVLGKSGDSLAALVGKRLGVIGRGGTPDMLIKYLLKQSGLEYVESDSAVSGKVAIKYYDNAGVMVPAYKTNVVDYGLFPEPAATTVSKAVEGTVRIAALHEAWQTLTGKTLTQAVLVAKKSLIASNKAYVDAFIEKVRLGKAFAESNAQEALSLINAHIEEGTAPSMTAATNEMVQRCNIGCIAASEAMTAVEAYLNSVIQIQDGVSSALDRLPERSFYYVG